MAVFLSCYAHIKNYVLPNYRDECKYISKVNVLANFQNMVVFVDFYMNARKGFK